MSRNTLSRRSQALRRLPPEQAPHALSVHEHPQNPQRELAQREAVRLLDVARDYAHKSHSPNTWRSYQSDWRIFERWCSSVELPPLPASASTVAMFIAAEAEQQRNPSTIARRLAAIRLLHQGVNPMIRVGVVRVVQRAVSESHLSAGRPWSLMPKRAAMRDSQGLGPTGFVS